MNIKNRSLLIQFYFKICIGTKRNYTVDELRIPYTYNAMNEYNVYRDLNFKRCTFDKFDFFNIFKDVQSTAKNIKDYNSVKLSYDSDSFSHPYLSNAILNDSSLLNKELYDDSKPFDNFITLTEFQLDQDNSNLQKINFDDSKEILKHLDNNEFVEPSKKELDECRPVSLDFDCLNELLNGKQEVKSAHINSSSKHLPISSQSNLPKLFFYDVSDDKKIKLNIDMKEDGKCEFSNVFEYDSKILTSYKHNERFLNFKKDFLDVVGSKDYSLTLKSYLERYICENISDSYNSCYLTRLQSISDASDIFDKFKFNCKTQYYKFNFSDDTVLGNKLIDMTRSFDQSFGFNKEAFDKFSDEFNFKIFDNFYSYKFWSEIERLSVYQKKLLFYSELMKHYKIVAEIPEILILGGIYEDKTFFNLPFIMHSINLFVEKIGNIKNNKVFILCLICKAFKCFRTNMFDLFLIPYYGFLCNKSRHDLTFFTWELNTRKRQSIARRKTRVFKYNLNDEKYLKTIFLIYLYQYSLFIKYYNINSKNINQFKRFVDRVIHSEKCLGCLFEEYLSIMNVINKAVF